MTMLTALQDKEARYVRHVRDKLEGHSNCDLCSFVGFVFRGETIAGGRESYIGLSRRARRAIENRFPQVNTDAKVINLFRSVLEVYLGYVGQERSVANLFLELRAMNKGKGRDLNWCRIKTDSGDISHSSLASHGSANFERGLAICIGTELRKELFKSVARPVDQLWTALASASSKSARDQAKRKARQEMDDDHASAIMRVTPLLFQRDHCDLIGGSVKELFNARDPLPFWRWLLGGIRGLQLFAPIGFDTWFGCSTPNPVRDGVDSCLALLYETPKEQVETTPEDHAEEFRDGIQPQRDSIVDASFENTREGHREEFRAKFGGLMEQKFDNELFGSEHLVKIADVVARLIGLEYEGEALQFTFLFAKQTDLLRVHSLARPRLASKAVERELGLPYEISIERLFHIDREHFKGLLDQALEGREGSASQDPQEKENEAMRQVLKESAHVLQAPGALLFWPVTSPYPTEVVRISPFDLYREKEYWAELGGGKGSAVFVVRGGEAMVFHCGQVVATANLAGWKAKSGGLFAGPNAEWEILRRLRSLVEKWYGLDVTSEGGLAMYSRLRKVVEAAIEIRRRGHGALFFLGREDAVSDPQPATALGQIIGRKKRYLDDDAAEVVAGFASLDGETVIDLDTSRYWSRQFVVVPEDHFVRFRTMEGETVEEGEVFDRFMTDRKKVMERLGEDGKGAETRRESSFGTRHMKALRATWYGRPAPLALTVSSSGAIRLWVKGLPMRW